MRTIFLSRLLGMKPGIATALAAVSLVSVACGVISSGPTPVTSEGASEGGGTAPLDFPAARPPHLISPEAGAVLDNGCMSGADPIVWDFDWAAVRGSTQYNLYVKHSGSTIPVINANLPSSSYHSASFAYIADVNRFDWRWKVRANVNGAWSAWSREWWFNAEPLNSDCPQ